MLKVSIITTTFNSGKTVGDTLQSVLNQTYSNIEYWIVDGQSKDNTMDVVRSFEEAFGGRLHYISEKDKGIYDAMNKGIRSATGDIVGILNSDDYFTADDVVENVVKALEADASLDAVYADVHFINPDNPDRVVRYYSSSVFRPSLLRFGFMPAHPTFYARREVYEKHGLYSLDYRIASDYDMMVRLFYRNGIKSKYINKDFVTMRVGGMSTKNVSHRLLINKEDVKACRRYGLKTNRLLICMKYLYKIFEFKL